MNRISQCVLIVALALVAVTGSAAKNKDNPVWRMSSGSNDGDKSYYTIWCKDKSIGSVIAEHDKQRYCALPKGGKRRCNEKWSLAEASVQACRVRK